MPESQRLKPGMILRHFKGGSYRFINIAAHSETGEKFAIYESLETGKICARPIEMFLSPVDKEKYPDAAQEWRFEACADQRLSWNRYFMNLAEAVAERSVCLRRKVGAVAVNKNRRILGTGYNGPPSGMGHCTKETCIRTAKNIPSGKEIDICRAIHAEANIVLQLGDKLSGATIYCTTMPCVTCAKLLMGAGVSRIIWKEGYPDGYGAELMDERFDCRGKTPEGYWFVEKNLKEIS